MFKRVEKRRRKKEEEEELGLDEDMKEVLGMHDTDSEESASDSDDSDSDGGEGSEDEQEDLHSDNGYLEEDDLDIADEESEDEVEQPVITVQEALRDPVYLISLEPTVKGCIAHERRVKQFTALASGVNSKSNAWDLLAEQAEKKGEKPSLAAPSETSKRAQKRSAQAALRKERHLKQKIKAKAKKASTTTPSSASTETTTVTASPTNKPPKKKPKITGTTSSPPKTADPTPVSRENDSKSIAAIARSASDRAKSARARATQTRAKPNPKPKRNPKIVS
ncbi:hypothetical protein DXG01_007143 [Tephrocybe rancida]|nr:hypothetical protein DXG01_007143 [Tephrocybe rancida]